MLPRDSHFISPRAGELGQLSLSQAGTGQEGGTAKEKECGGRGTATLLALPLISLWNGCLERGRRRRDFCHYPVVIELAGDDGRGQGAGRVHGTAGVVALQGQERSKGEEGGEREVRESWALPGLDLHLHWGHLCREGALCSSAAGVRAVPIRVLGVCASGVLCVSLQGGWPTRAVTYPQEVAQGHGEADGEGRGAQVVLPAVVGGGKDTEHQLQSQEELHGHGLPGCRVVVELQTEGAAG